MPWPDPVISVAVHHPGDVSALLLGSDERVRGSGDLVFYNQPEAQATTWSAGPPQTVRVALGALDAAITTVRILLSVDPGADVLGRQPVPRAELAGRSGVLATFSPDGLTTERALIVCELYRRGPGWRVRAVGQGYDGGLPQALTVHGVVIDDQPAAARPAQGGSGSIPPVPPPRPLPAPDPPPATLPLPPPGTSPGERLIRQASAILEDASRSTASLRSTLVYAEDRLLRVLEQLVADPATRLGANGDAARAAAHRDHDAMVDQARANHGRDIAQLRAEVTEWEAAVPAAMAPWTASVWQQEPTEPSPAVRVGTLQVEDTPDLAVPLLLGLPLSRPLWIDTAAGGELAAATLLRTLAIRMQAAATPDRYVVSIVDVGAANPVPLPAFWPTANEPAAVTGQLTDLVRDLDLIEMAYQAGYPQALEELDRRPRLLLVHDVPTGLSEEDLRLLIRLVESGPTGRVQLILTGTDSESIGHPATTALLRSCQRVPCGTGGVLTDGYGGTSWNFTPDAGPDGRLLAEIYRHPQRLV